MATDRILALRSTPAEARPNERVDYDTLIVSPHGIVNRTPRYSYCLVPRVAEERRGVSEECIGGDALLSIDVSTTIQSDACSRFGPITPSLDARGIARRPSDPDLSGGYYVPVEAKTELTRSFGMQRIRCDLPGATRRLFEEF